jgi:hypothetical protein
MPARHSVLPSPPPTSGSPKLLFYKINYPINRLESTLLQVFILGDLKPFGINTYEKQGEGCQLWLTKYYKKVSLAADCLPARQASLSVGFPHFHFSIFRSFLPLWASAPLRANRSSIFRIFFQVPYPLSPLPATLTKTAGVYTNNSHSGTPNFSTFNFQLSTVDFQYNRCVSIRGANEF